MRRFKQLLKNVILSGTLLIFNYCLYADDIDPNIKSNYRNDAPSNIEQGKKSILLAAVKPERYLRFSSGTKRTEVVDPCLYGKFSEYDQLPEDKVLLEAFDESGASLGTAVYIFAPDKNLIELPIKDLPFGGDPQRINLIKASSENDSFFGSITEYIHGKSGDNSSTTSIDYPGIQVSNQDVNEILLEYFRVNGKAKVKSTAPVGAQSCSDESTAAKQAAGATQALSCEASSYQKKQSSLNGKAIAANSTDQDSAPAYYAIPGLAAQVPITYSGPAASAIELTIKLPPKFIFIEFKAGESSNAALKDVESQYHRSGDAKTDNAAYVTLSRTKQHSPDDSLRVIIAGLNQTALPEGTIAYLNFGIIRSARRGIQNITLENIVASSPNATELQPSSYQLEIPPINVGMPIYFLKTAKSSTPSSEKFASAAVEDDLEFGSIKGNPIRSKEVYFPAIHPNDIGSIGIANPNNANIGVTMIGHNHEQDSLSKCTFTLGPGEYRMLQTKKVFSGEQIDWLGAQSENPVLGFQNANAGGRSISRFAVGNNDLGEVLLDPKPESQTSYSLLNITNRNINLRISGFDNYGASLAETSMQLRPNASITKTIGELFKGYDRDLQNIKQVQFRDLSEIGLLAGTTSTPSSGLEPLVNVSPEPEPKIYQDVNNQGLAECPRQETDDTIAYVTGQNRASSSTAAALLGSAMMASTNNAYKAAVNSYKNQVTLAWDATPGTVVAGYKIYRGSVSGNYDTIFTVAGANTLTTICPILQYDNYFAATTYNSSGNESIYSNEVSVRGFGLMDIDNSGAANVIDLQIEANVLLGTRPCPADCDVDKNSSTNANDYTAIVNFLLGRSEAP